MSLVGDFFWTLATSYVSLALVAGVLIAALVVGWAPLLKYAPVIGPYVPVARLVSFLAFGLLCALLDRGSADQRAKVAQLQHDLAFTELQLANMTATAADKSRLAQESAAAAEDAKQKVDGYEQWLKTQPVVAGCDISPGDAKRLRDIRPRRAR